MKKLLLPYAYDSTGHLVHIDNARKGERYTCPTCGAELTLKISKIPEGEKYHRPNHFAHKVTTDNNCSESFLHKLFKEKTTDFIRAKMVNKENVLQFEWDCEKCREHHIGNLLKKAVIVREEYDMQCCRPDIALLDNANNVKIVIEVVVTHEPTPEVIQFYDDNRIACLQIRLISFDDCNNIEYKLTHPDVVNLCPNPICEECGHALNRAILVTKKVFCSICHTELRYPIIIKGNEFVYRPSEFTKNEIGIANKLGANIVKSYKGNAINRCIRCNSYIGCFPTDGPYEKEEFIGYKCLNCEMNKYIAERELECRINQKIMHESIKNCPQCGGILILRKSLRGYFYGCKNYPDCNYMENIELDV